MNELHDAEPAAASLDDVTVEWPTAASTAELTIALSGEAAALMLKIGPETVSNAARGGAPDEGSATRLSVFGTAAFSRSLRADGRTYNDYVSLAAAKFESRVVYAENSSIHSCCHLQKRA